MSWLAHFFNIRQQIIAETLIIKTEMIWAPASRFTKGMSFSLVLDERVTISA